MDNVVTTQRVYVWELPVRFYHWINAAAVVVLAITGYLIGRPLAIQSATEASSWGEPFCARAVRLNT